MKTRSWNSSVPLLHLGYGHLHRPPVLTIPLGNDVFVCPLVMADAPRLWSQRAWTPLDHFHRCRAYLKLSICLDPWGPRPHFTCLINAFVALIESPPFTVLVATSSFVFLVVSGVAFRGNALTAANLAAFCAVMQIEEEVRGDPHLRQPRQPRLPHLFNIAFTYLSSLNNHSIYPLIFVFFKNKMVIGIETPLFFLPISQTSQWLSFAPRRARKMRGLGVNMTVVDV